MSKDLKKPLTALVNNKFKSVFGGEFTNVTRLKEMENPGFQVTEVDADKLMHIALPIGNNVLMGNDVPSFMGTVNEKENRTKISVNCDSKEEADRVFNVLSVGGEVEVPIGDSPYRMDGGF